MTTTKEYIDQAMGAMLEGDNDRALGLLLRASLAYDDEFARASAAMEPAMRGIVFEEARASTALDGDTYSLPPIQPINGGKKKAPIDFKCPTCGAKPGKPCVKMSARGKGDNPLGEPLVAGKRHDARRKLWNIERGLA